MNRKLKMGMVGGGRGAFIGGVHRRAANLDGQIELVAGAFSSDPKKSKLSGKDFYIDPARTYGSYQEMAEKEALLPVGERIDFVSIVVQNYLHFDVAKTGAPRCSASVTIAGQALSHSVPSPTSSTGRSAALIMAIAFSIPRGSGLGW